MSRLTAGLLPLVARILLIFSLGVSAKLSSDDLELAYAYVEHDEVPYTTIYWTSTGKVETSVIVHLSTIVSESESAFTSGYTSSDQIVFVFPTSTSSSTPSSTLTPSVLTTSSTSPAVTTSSTPSTSSTLPTTTAIPATSSSSPVTSLTTTSLVATSNTPATTTLIETTTRTSPESSTILTTTAILTTALTSVTPPTSSSIPTTSSTTETTSTTPIKTTPSTSSTSFTELTTISIPTSSSSTLVTTTSTSYVPTSISTAGQSTSADFTSSILSSSSPVSSTSSSPEGPTSTVSSPGASTTVSSEGPTTSTSSHPATSEIANTSRSASITALLPTLSTSEPSRLSVPTHTSWAPSSIDHESLSLSTGPSETNAVSSAVFLGSPSPVVSLSSSVLSSVASENTQSSQSLSVSFHSSASTIDNTSSSLSSFVGVTSLASPSSSTDLVSTTSPGVYQRTTNEINGPSQASDTKSDSAASSTSAPVSTTPLSETHFVNTTLILPTGTPSIQTDVPPPQDSTNGLLTTKQVAQTESNIQRTATSIHTSQVSNAPAIPKTSEPITSSSSPTDVLPPSVATSTISFLSGPRSPSGSGDSFSPPVQAFPPPSLVPSASSANSGPPPPALQLNRGNMILPSAWAYGLLVIFLQ